MSQRRSRSSESWFDSAGHSRDPRSLPRCNFLDMSDHASIGMILVTGARAFRELCTTARNACIPDAGLPAQWGELLAAPDLAKFAKSDKVLVIVIGQIPNLTRLLVLRSRAPPAGRCHPAARGLRELLLGATFWIFPITRARPECSLS